MANATVYVISTNGIRYDATTNKAKALRIAADLVQAADMRMNGDTVEVRTMATAKRVFFYVAPVIAEDEVCAVEVYATNVDGEENLYAYVPNGTRESVREWLNSARTFGTLTNVRAVRYVAPKAVVVDAYGFDAEDVPMADWEREVMETGTVAPEPVVERFCILPNGVEIMGAELPRECYYGCDDVWGAWFDYVGTVQGVCERHESRLSHLDVARIQTRTVSPAVCTCDYLYPADAARFGHMYTCAMWDEGFQETESLYVASQDANGSRVDADAWERHQRAYFIPGTNDHMAGIDADAYSSGVQNANDTAKEEGFIAQSARWFAVFESSYVMMRDENAAERENARGYLTMGTHGIMYVGNPDTVCGEPVRVKGMETLSVSVDVADVDCSKCIDGMNAETGKDGFGNVEDIITAEDVAEGDYVMVRPFYLVPVSRSGMQSTRSPWTYRARVTEMRSSHVVVDFLSEYVGNKTQAFELGELHSMKCRCAACDGEGITRKYGA